MKNRICLGLAVMFACLAVVGCDQDEATTARQEKAASEAREQAERQRRLDAEHARAEVEQRALAAEKQASDSATSKWAWIVVVALIGTVTGVAIRKKVTADYIKQKRGD